MDCSLPGSSVHGISQARILEWVAISFSRGSSLPRDRTQVPCIAGRIFYKLAFPGSSDGKESACNAGDLCSITKSGRSPAEGSGNSLQCACLENPMDKPWGLKESDRTERLFHCLYKLSHQGSLASPGTLKKKKKTTIEASTPAPRARVTTSRIQYLMI